MRALSHAAPFTSGTPPFIASPSPVADAGSSSGIIELIETLMTRCGADDVPCAVRSAVSGEPRGDHHITSAQTDVPPLAQTHPFFGTPKTLAHDPHAACSSSHIVEWYVGFTAPCCGCCDGEQDDGIALRRKRSSLMIKVREFRAAGLSGQRRTEGAWLDRIASSTDTSKGPRRSKDCGSNQLSYRRMR